MLKEYLSTLANAFREVLGTTKKINAQNFESEIYSVFAKGHQTGKIAGFEQGKLELLQDSEYMNAKVSGTAISANDVSEVNHHIDCSLSSKNLLPYSKFKPTQTINGITFTNNGDGSITLNGTATAEAIFACIEETKAVSLKVGTYTLSGGLNSSIYLQGKVVENDIFSIFNKNEKSTFTFNYDFSFRFNIRVSSGTVCENVVIKPQLEIGTTATEYTPYVADVGGIEVSRYGKNLFDINLDPHSIHYAVRLVSLNDGELTIKQNYNTAFASYNIAIPNTKKLVGKTITISCDCKVGEGGNNTTVRVLWVNANGNSIAGTDILYKPYVSSTEYQHISVSGVVNAQPDESHDTLALMFYSNVTGTISDGEYYAYFKNIQIELGTTATAYEPYIKPTTYQSTADGTVDGIKSISPNMTLLTNNNVVINANYLRDIDTYIDNLKTNVALTGGE